MPGRRRILLAAGWALSVLLCAGVVALCVRSYGWHDHLIAYDNRPEVLREGNLTARNYSVASFRGIVRFGRTTAQLPADVTQGIPQIEFTGPRWRWDRRSFEAGLYSDAFGLDNGAGYGGFTQGATIPGGATTYTFQFVTIPDWALLLPLAIPAGRVLARMIRRWRKGRPGTCASCGYDLRATPERCPECGTSQLKESIHRGDAENAAK